MEGNKNVTLWLLCCCFLAQIVNTTAFVSSTTKATNISSEGNRTSNTSADDDVYLHLPSSSNETRLEFDLSGGTTTMTSTSSTPVSHDGNRVGPITPNAGIVTPANTDKNGSGHTQANRTAKSSSNDPSQAANIFLCRYQFTQIFSDSLYTIDNVLLKSAELDFTILPGQSRCYMTREDFESRLRNFTTGPELVGHFWFKCREPGTQVLFMENYEVENMSEEGGGGGEGAEQLEKDVNLTEGRKTRGGPDDPNYYNFYPNFIGYLKTLNCGVSLKGIDIVANMTDLKVLGLLGTGATSGFAELESRPELCRAFRGVASLVMAHDLHGQRSLELLSLCAGNLNNIAELFLVNGSLTYFPERLKAALPNNRALMLKGNKLTSPVYFPWSPGYAELPRNLSRNYKFNFLYSYDDMIDIEPNLFRRVYVFDGNRIQNMTTFELTGEFQYVSFEYNELRKITDSVFRQVEDLQFLSLANNKLESLPEDLFVGLSKLKKLDLHNNKLKHISPNIFRSLRNLEHLNLAGNQLTVLQDNLFLSLQKLTDLILSNNSISEISRHAISPLSVQLKHVDLQNNPLTEFPVVLLLLAGLEEANLDRTHIEVLDFVEIDRETFLMEIMRGLVNPSSGEYAKITDTPTYQKRISLRHSKLRSVVVYDKTPETLQTFIFVIKFYTVNVEGSPLACDANILNVTHEVESWKAKGILTGEEPCLKQWKCAWPEDLHGRTVTSLKDEETYTLMESSGGENDSSSSSCPEACACYMRTRVQTGIVDCKRAGLTSLPPRVPPNTRELWLQNNTIKSLEKLPYLRDLHHLKLSSNNLQDLPQDVISFMKDLRLLYVDDNWLTGLSSPLEQVKQLRVAGNRFRCDCHTLWMKDWLLGHQNVVEDWLDVQCSVEGKDGWQVFTSVPNDQFICKASATLGQLAVPIAVPVTFFAAILTLCIVAFLQRRRLKVLLYIHTGLHPFDRDLPDDVSLYDVTVCCGLGSRDWVLQNVIKPLEERGFRVFFYSRDAFVGVTTLENVHYCIENSRRLVVVLGESWDQDDLLVTATREALAKCHKDIVHFLTVVVHQLSPKDIDNKDMQQYIKGQRYIDTEDKHFLKKLLYEMPELMNKVHHDDEKEEMDYLQVTDIQGKPVTLNDIAVAADDENLAVNALNLRNLRSGIGNAAVVIDVDMKQHHAHAEERDVKSVFVWYAEDDLQYTLRQIVVPLETLGHKCILQDRDFCIGAAIQENIVQAAETCERSVFVLSNQTPRNEWFTFAFHVTFDRHLQGKEQQMALVTREGVDVTNCVEEVQQVVKTSAVLSEGDPWFQARLVKFVQCDVMVRNL
uniref:Toll-like receptor 9.1 n=1 Tax=Littorina littorea TaxID=31216 RepID=A0A7G8ZA03_LITLI|nr:toll-like receptor 9.1 [Littorina littorea]